MNTIYMVTPCKNYWDDVYEGFATDEAGIQQIIYDHYRDYFCKEPGMLRVSVNMKTKTVVVHDLANEMGPDTYHIQTVERATA